MPTEVWDNVTSPGTFTSLALPCASTDTQIVTRSPASTTLAQPGTQFRIIVIDPETEEAELMLVTFGAWSPTWIVERGIEGTLPLDFPQDAVVRHVLTRDGLQNIIIQVVTAAGV